MALSAEPLPRARSPRTPLILGAGLFAFGLLAILYRPLTVMETLSACLTLVVLVAVAAYDSATLRAPNSIVYPGAVIIPLTWAATGLSAVIGSFIGGVLALLVTSVLVIIGRGSMGFGDAKFAFLAGAAVGIGGLVIMFGAAFVVGGMLAAAVLVTDLRKRDDSIAFTPFLVGGVIVAWMFIR